MNIIAHPKSRPDVVPVNPGVRSVRGALDSRFRGNDDRGVKAFWECGGLLSVAEQAFIGLITVVLTMHLVLPCIASGDGQFAGVFRIERINALVLSVVFGAAVLWYIAQARRGAKMYIRPIPGLSAVDEAVGRATEMGRPVVFIPGTGDLDEIQTIAGLSILGRVARVTARYNTPLRVPVLYPLPMAAAQETVREAYLDEGVEHQDPETVQYVAGESFSYSARVGGIMMRERPGAAIYMGLFTAESLLIAEVGQSTGAIQIAGTAAPDQLPFFIAACDYVLIGEELYAASAYLSGDPKILGSLKGQDLMKIVITVIVLAGVLAITFGQNPEWLTTIFEAK
ncbi:MAG: hypothetical protein HZB43_00505 [candidate division Zixibacteria bacterium]|nr:hypothetical protein [candidate division Zixibacteria bacterium]